MTAQAAVTQNPKTGKYWEGHGGIVAGILRNELDQEFYLILPIALEASIKAPWGKYGTTIEGQFSVIDGQHNTQLILQAEPENLIAKQFASLCIDGKTDFYWPARKELNLIEINLPEFYEKILHWSSTQCSANYAWYQYFRDGGQYIDRKNTTLAARAVRRELII